jgi:ABC-2 type transport system ATP-binding protein
MGSGEILISINEVYRYYGSYCAVNNASFTIERGEVLGFLGPNGAGKTTTMQIISGVLAPSAGKVSIVGVDIIDAPKTAKMHIGFLPEQPPLYLDMTVDEYLHYAARLRRIDRKKIRAAIDNCKQRCGLKDAGHRLLKNLSKGYRQRAGIAQAIIHTPAVIILDEPTNGLDPIQIREIRDLIRELGQDHSVILSTHILPEVQTVCNRVLIINNGRLVLDQKLGNLAKENREKFVRVGFRQPPAVETLTTISGINSVEAVSAQQFLIGFDPASSAIDTITQRSVNSCWGLCEMVPDTDSLEEIFMRLTSGASDEPMEKIEAV